MIPDTLKCAPGERGTALDVCIDNAAERFCGMCLEPTKGQLHGICEKCGHRWEYFQINTCATGIGGWSDLRRYMRQRGLPIGTAETEANLKEAITKYVQYLDECDGIGGDWE